MSCCLFPFKLALNCGIAPLQAELGIPIVHETHRRRLFWNPFNFRDILKEQPDLDAIKINLDISHWVVCLERIFDSPTSHHMNGEVDGWWPEVLEMLKQRCWLIHARVGYEEGPLGSRSMRTKSRS